MLAGLLRAALGGNEKAYAEFLRRTAALVRGFVGRKTQGGADVEDVVQETLLAIHLKRHTWRQDAAVLPWLYAIARYKLIDAWRRRGRRVDVDIDDFRDMIAAPEPQESLSERDLGRVLDALPAGQRSVVSSISVDGNSIGETAAKLGMNETAVRVALHRGLKALAARFGRGET
ncbi:MAG: sigma-70 family RNA polymerase sigma factor [Rhizobiaceae bacterium]|nr:sigma-70 family RNA polymerase sigma factor [Rhizobiaceae bacterium]